MSKSKVTTRFHILVASYRRFTRKSLQVSIISCSKVIESSREDHEKLSVFTSLSSIKLLKVHSIATTNWQYLFLAGHSKLFNVYEDVRASRTPPKFSRMLFNTQIISHYNNTFSVWSAISQYHQSIFRININPNQNSRSYCFRLKNCNNCLKSIY